MGTISDRIFCIKRALLQISREFKGKIRAILQSSLLGLGCYRRKFDRCPVGISMVWTKRHLLSSEQLKHNLYQTERELGKRFLLARKLRIFFPIGKPFLLLFCNRRHVWKLFSIVRPYNVCSLTSVICWPSIKFVIRWWVHSLTVLKNGKYHIFCSWWVKRHASIQQHYHRHYEWRIEVIAETSCPELLIS